MSKLLPFLCLLIISQLLTAQNKVADFKTESISIFKNGSAFYIKSATVNTNDGKFRITEDIPAALFGTLWMDSSTDEIKAISSFKDKVDSEEKRKAHTFLELLQSNPNKKLSLHLSDDKVIQGVVASIDIPDIKSNERVRVANPNRAMISFKTDNSWLSLRPGEIKRIEFLEEPNTNFTAKKSEEKPLIEVAFNSKKSQQNLDMMYLQNGLSWTPNYLVELKSENKASLTLRAEVSNDAQDILNTNINFVVGVPNFRYANRLSALVDFLQAVRPARNDFAAQTFSNVGSPIAYSIENNNSSSAGNVGNDIGGSAEEDLYFYQLKNFSLKKGGRGHYQIFKTDIDIAHIYECNLPNNNSNKNSYRSNFFFDAGNKNKVFHSIKVTNETKNPWTTGSALVVKKQGSTKPISQDRLPYTAIKGHSFVKLTESTDISIKHAEKVTNRQERVKKARDNYHYDLLTISGQVKIKSYKNKDIDLNIRRTITGLLDKTSVKWLSAEQVNINAYFNKINNVCWETNIKAGEEKVIDYSYTVYVRS